MSEQAIRLTQYSHGA
ncbi:hypothetical protein SEES7308_04311, partial [Salmonella enterica subsp. enterica serovar Stanley str. ATCC 7308]